jgi:hypothetical protein
LQDHEQARPRVWRHGQGSMSTVESQALSPYSDEPLNERLLDYSHVQNNSQSFAPRFESYIENYSDDYKPVEQRPHIFQSTSEPTLSMSQSMIPQPISHRLLQSFSHSSQHPYPSARRGRGYGKLTFVNKPDQLNDRTGWTAQELRENRRIIAFQKVGSGDAFQLACHPITSAEYIDHMLTISCIYFQPSPLGEIQHKLAGTCVFTSVDIILFMERLINYLFSVQEKNRIRRNLEGFHPVTIKKEGTTARFFTQVMAYSQPKVRNIEKDIKVFAWGDIVKALKKIVQKYHPDGRISLGAPMPALQTTLQLFHPMVASSQTSSSESLPSQRSFVDEYSQQALLSSPSQWVPSLHIEPGGSMLSLQDEGGESSYNSISPQSQTSQLVVPTAQYTRTDEFGHDGAGNYVAIQPAFEGYVQGMSGQSYL